MSAYTIAWIWMTTLKVNKLHPERPIEPVFTWLYEDDERGEETDSIQELRRGDLCPQCKQGRLDYDGLLNLSCDRCGYTLGGCFT